MIRLYDKKGKKMGGGTIRWWWFGEHLSGVHLVEPDDI